MFSVYILHSLSFNRYYSGQTSDLQVRLKSHNLGLNKSTKPYIPWRIFAWKEVGTRAEAMAMERKLKNLRSMVKMEKFIKRNNFIIHASEGRE